MIVHLFNSSSVSGPERLVLPALAGFPGSFMIVNLVEERISRLSESDPLEDYSRSLNLRYRAIPVKKRWDHAAIHELERVLEELQPDLVHAHAIKASVYLLQASRKRPHRCPIVSTHHGAHGLPDWKTRFYEWFYRKRYLTDYDRVLSVSSPDYDFLLNSGIDKERLRLHVNGINGRWLGIEDRLEEAHRIRSLWLPAELNRDSLFLFGVVGRLSQEKDHDRLLRVLSCLNGLPCDREWKCLIFGTGALEHRLRQQASLLDLEKRVVWMGYRKEVGNELAALDLVLSFSKAEGLPINLIEAGWAGTAVMATLVGGVHDLIPDDRYGIRVPAEESPAESASRLWKVLSNEGRTQLHAQGKQFQERVMHEFTQEKWMKRLEDIYSELNIALKVPCN